MPTAAEQADLDRTRHHVEHQFLTAHYSVVELAETFMRDRPLEKAAAEVQATPLSDQTTVTFRLAVWAGPQEAELETPEVTATLTVRRTELTRPEAVEAEVDTLPGTRLVLPAARVSAP